MSPAAEEELLKELASRGPSASEARLSLAVGTVARGRLSPQDAADLAGCRLDELVRASEPSADAPVVSLVVPAYNEEENLDALWERVRPVLDEAGTAELVIVDDGSADRTWEVIGRLARQDERVRGIRLSRNFGHQAALSAGMAEARGQTVCFLDADLQDPPELLTELLERWRSGYDVVYAVRRSRKEGVAKRFSYRAFYRLYRRFANIDVPVDSGDFALLDRRVVDAVLALPEHNRFLRGLRSWVGFRQIGVEYDRDARHAGEPKYTTRRLVRLAMDGLLSFSAVPLRLASYLGILVALAGGAYIAVALVYRFFLGGVPDGWTSIVAVVLTIGGMQLLVIGVLGEYVARVYDETKARPNFLVGERTAPPPSER